MNLVMGGRLRWALPLREPRVEGCAPPFVKGHHNRAAVHVMWCLGGNNPSSSRKGEGPPGGVRFRRKEEAELEEHSVVGVLPRSPVAGHRVSLRVPGSLPRITCPAVRPPRLLHVPIFSRRFAAAFAGRLYNFSEI